FICRGTVEEKIDALIESKIGLSSELLAGAGEMNLTEMQNSKSGLYATASRGKRRPGMMSLTGAHGAAFSAFGRRAFAQLRQDHAYVQPRRRKRFPAPALARDRRQAGLPAL